MAQKTVAKQIAERNEEIALMLGYINKTPTDKDFKIFEFLNKIGVIPSMIETMSMKFHLDWNWIMEAVSFINKTHNQNNPHRDFSYTIKHLLNGGWWGEKQIPIRTLSDIEQLFLAVSDFAKLYNEGKL